MGAAAALPVQHGRPCVAVELQPRPGRLLEGVHNRLDLLVGRLVLRRPRDHAGRVPVLEGKRIGHGGHLVGISPEHLDAFARLPGRVKLAEQVLGRLAGRSGSVRQELKVHPGPGLSAGSKALSARLMAIRWPITSTASTASLWAFAQRAIWLRLFPTRATCRVRSRSTSACATVQVCVRPTARRTRSDSVKPAERALACHSARSASLARTFTQTARPGLMARRFRFGGHRGHSPPPASAGDSRSVAPRSKLAEPRNGHPASPWAPRPGPGGDRHRSGGGTPPRALRGTRSDAPREARLAVGRGQVRRTDPASANVAGHGHRFRLGVDQPDYLRLLRCFASFAPAALHASVTRRAASYAFHPLWVSIQPSGKARACPRGRVEQRLRWLHAWNAEEPLASKSTRRKSPTVPDRSRSCQNVSTSPDAATSGVSKHHRRPLVGDPHRENGSRGTLRWP